MANKETSSHLIPSQKSTRVDRITYPLAREKKKIGYDMQPKDRIPPYTLRHIIYVMSWGEQDPVSIRTRLHVPYFAESFFFHRLFLSHATSSSFLSLFFFLFPFFSVLSTASTWKGLATARADYYYYQQYLRGSWEVQLQYWRDTVVLYAICYVRSETICLRLQCHRLGKDVLAGGMDMKQI